MGDYFYMGRYNHRSVIFAKQPLIAWQIYRNIPYVEISPVDVVSLEVESLGLQAGNLNELHSFTLATVAWSRSQNPPLTVAIGFSRYD